jgi:hypothetical protein
MLTAAQARLAYLPTALTLQAGLIALIALIMNQWFALEAKHAWWMAGLVAMPAAMFVMPFTGTLLGWLSRGHSVPFMGEKIP